MNLKSTMLKDKKMISEKLRVENKKMELRLQQLKLAMNKEKEERLSNGTHSNWISGSPGAILNYKPNISGIDSGKKIRLKMLKEETIAPAAVRPTIKSSILRDIAGGEVLISKNDSNCDRNASGKTRNCGQCEENAAAVNCKECAEDYCPKCFAAFHLKGALRKHRSTPISNLNNRISIPSPLFKPPDLYSTSNRVSQEIKSSSRMGDRKTRKPNSRNENRNEPTESSKENELPAFSGSSLADGVYNEELSNQYFQDAINAWRNDVEITEPVPFPNKLPTTEHSTETTTNNNKKKLLSDLIQFTPSLTYAEQLLLRKHRNNQLASDDMKYILNRLTKTNEKEVLENKKLLESNLVLETSLINNSTENALKNDQYHIDFDAVNKLLNDADSINLCLPSMNGQAAMKSPFKIEELVHICDDEGLERNPPQDSRLSNNINVNNSQMPDQIMNQIDIPSTADRNAPESERSNSNTKRSKSVINRNNFYGRPSSARRLSTRQDNGGGYITSKPSLLLTLLANFINYVPSIEDVGKENISTISRPSSANVCKQANKISFNLYKLTPNTWKPAHAWPNESQTDLHDMDKTMDISSENDDIVDNEMEKELINLNLLSNKPKADLLHSSNTVSDLKMSLKSSNSDNDNDNRFNETDMNLYDEETETQETFSQLKSLERELTVISRQTDISLRLKCDENIIDSLDMTNGNECIASMDSDKFCFEDSLDFQQRYSNNSNRVQQDGNDDEDEMLINCSSRFDDYDDVHKLN